MRKWRQSLRIGTLMLTGSFVMQFNACTLDDVQAQFSNGLQTALTGLFQIGAQSFADNLFDVDD